ncbi:MAG: hypothetical protein WC495_02720 [Patescibacteria group bacterium]|jgi:hypothetical protein
MNKIFIVSLLLILCLAPVAVHASFKFDSGGVIKDALQLTDKNMQRTTMDFVLFALSIVGLIAVVMIIYSGIRYMTSGGNQEVIQNARAILKWSIVGLVVIILSQVILVTIVNIV